MFIIHFPVDPLELINDFWTVGLINDGVRTFIIAGLPMMASCFDNILHDNLQKIRLHRNDLLLPRFWPDHRSKLQACKCTCKEFYHASLFLYASRQAELIYLCCRLNHLPFNFVIDIL